MIFEKDDGGVGDRPRLNRTIEVMLLSLLGFRFVLNREVHYAQTRRKAYRDLLHTHLDPDVVNDIRASTNGNFVLCSERFKREISTMLNRRVIPARAGRPFTED